VLTSEFEGTTFAIRRVTLDGPKVAVVFIWGNGPTDRVPFDVIRSICADLDLTEDMFGIEH
jgi:hypothetical protein